MYLLIENPSKGNNLGPILRCAAAFAVHQVIFVGYEKCGTDGSHGASRHVDIVAFPTFAQAATYLKGDECQVSDVIGVLGDLPLSRELQNEPCPVQRETVVANGVSWLTARVVPLSMEGNTSTFAKSQPIHHRPFSKGGKNVCFLVSKKRFGLPASQAELCTSFVHVPTLQMTPTSSKVDTHSNNSLDGDSLVQCGFVDTQTCLSIVLHHYTAAKGYKERDFEKQKFQVAKVVKGSTGADKRRLEREQRRKELAREDDMDEEQWVLFDETSDY